MLFRLRICMKIWISWWNPVSEVKIGSNHETNFGRQSPLKSWVFKFTKAEILPRRMFIQWVRIWQFFMTSQKRNRDHIIHSLKVKIFVSISQKFKYYLNQFLVYWLRAVLSILARHLTVRVLGTTRWLQQQKLQN